MNSKRIVLTRWVQEHEEEAHNGTLGTAEEETEDEKHTHTFGRGIYRDSQLLRRLATAKVFSKCLVYCRGGALWKIG